MYEGEDELLRPEYRSYHGKEEKQYRETKRTLTAAERSLTRNLNKCVKVVEPKNQLEGKEKIDVLQNSTRSRKACACCQCASCPSKISHIDRTGSRATMNAS